jgi:hypothetical protein
MAANAGLVETTTRTDTPNIILRRYEDVGGAVSVRRISWGAVLAGSAVGLVFQTWLAMLGVAIGASTIDPLKEANPMSGVGIGSVVWLGLSILLSSFVGGWVAGRLAGVPRRMESALHGAVSWAVATGATFLLMGTVFGAMLGGASKIAGGAMNAAGGAASAAGQAAGPNGIDQAKNAITQGAQNLIDQGQNAIQSGQAQQQARQVGEKATKAVAGTSWGLVIVMFLGLCAGVGGASLATPSMPYYGRHS